MNFYDSNQGLSITVPQISAEQANIEMDMEDSLVVAPIIQDQIENLNDLLNPIEFDVFSNVLSDFIESEIEFIHNNYIQIHDLDNIMENENQVSLTFAFLYDLIVSEMIEYILPNVIKHQDIALQDLILLDSSKLKESIFSVIKLKLDKLNEIRKIAKDSSLDLDFTILKYTWYYDLFDSDLTEFKENVVTTIVLKYETELSANINYL